MSSEHERNTHLSGWPAKLAAAITGSRRKEDGQDDTEKVDEELSCPICSDTLKEASVTKCGHSFCYECIAMHLANHQDCPICRSSLTMSEIYPNFLLNKLTTYRIKSVRDTPSPDRHLNPTENLIKYTSKDYKAIANSLANALSSEDLTAIFETALKQCKEKEVDQTKVKKELLLEFLSELEERNEKKAQELALENVQIKADLQFLANQDEQASSSSSSSSNNRKRKFVQISEPEEDKEESTSENEGCSIKREENSEEIARRLKQEGGHNSLTASRSDSSLRRRLEDRFDDLSHIYHKVISANDTVNKRRKLLSEFSNSIYQLIRYDHFDVLDTLEYTSSARPGGSIVSTMEFDRDQEYFAVGGVTKEIKIFDFNMMGYATSHCPLRVLRCESKISCLSWSPYIKSQLASSDYTGLISIWDCTAGREAFTFKEHESRAWSVDYCQSNPTMLTSGSDDGTVKVWSLTQSRSVHTFSHKGNVCCVKFAPDNSYSLAVGCADHNVSRYDLRYPSQPVCVYKGHKKAVSYVKWLNDQEIVSASTDSTLKLWDKETGECKHSFSGHQNEKNFVGLSTNGDWIACGSESNTVYTYHKDSDKPIATYTFASNTEEDNAFVSSVCWKADSLRMLAANSKGVIKVLSMK